MKKEQVTVYLPPDLARQAKLIAKRDHASVSEVVAELARRGLEALPSERAAFSSEAAYLAASELLARVLKQDVDQVRRSLAAQAAARLKKAGVQYGEGVGPPEAGEN
jgi:cytidylate kinase